MDPIIPKPKPFTEEQFKLNTDRRIKGALGGFDKGEMVDLIQKNLNMLKESGVMEYDDAISFIKERTKELKEFIKENPGETSAINSSKLLPTPSSPPAKSKSFLTICTFLVPPYWSSTLSSKSGTFSSKPGRGGEEGVGKSFEEFMADVLFEGDYLNDD